MTPAGWPGFWRLADPKITLASTASMFLGAAAAARDGPLDACLLAATVLGIWAVEVAKNASGEVFDYDGGTDLAVRPEDRSPFSGGKRVLVDGLLSREQTIGISVAGYAVGAAVFQALIRQGPPGLVCLGLAGAALSFFYHAPPLRLSYRGLGEAAVALAYGPLISGGTYLLQRGVLPAKILLLGCPLGLMIGAFLWVNEFPDHDADRATGKRTCVVRLGRPRAAAAFAVIVVAALALLAALPALGFPPAVCLGGVAAWPAARAARRLLAAPESTPDIIAAQEWTLKAFLLLAVGTGMGLLVG